jgi:hypothetical protein
LDQTTLVGAGGDDISLNPSAKIRELERINALNEKRIEEVRIWKISYPMPSF